MPSTADLLDSLRRFVQAEAETQYESLPRQWARLIGERVANGWAIEGINVVHEQKGIIRLVCDTNNSRFRAGISSIGVSVARYSKWKPENRRTHARTISAFV